MEKTTFRIEPGAAAPGWVVRRVPEAGGPAGIFLGAGPTGGVVRLRRPSPQTVIICPRWTHTRP